MAIDPRIAELLGGSNGGGPRLQRHEIFKFANIGDEIIGKIVEVGEPFQAKSKFYNPLAEDESKRGREFIKTWVWNLETSSGMRTLWLTKPGQFKSVAEALIESDLSYPEPGFTFGMKWSGLGPANGMGSRPHEFKSKFVK